MPPIDEKKLQELSDKVDKIYYALIGNELSQDGGITERLKRLENKVDELTEFKDKSRWTASLLIGVAGICGFLIDKILDYIISKH